MLEAIAQKCEGLMLKLLDSATVVKDEIKEEDEGDEGTADEDEDVTADVDEAVKAEDDQGEDDDNTKKRGRRKALLATYEPDKRVESWVS